MVLSVFSWVRSFCSTQLLKETRLLILNVTCFRLVAGSYCFVITNPALHTGLLKFDYFVVLEQQSCSMLIAMYEMHGKLIIN